MAENLPAPSPSSPPLDIEASEMLSGDVTQRKLETGPPRFLKEKHIKYWLRCFSTPLPHQYQANDASLMSLTFFILSALDLLGALDTHTSPTERQTYVEAIYACQHPDGGFRGFRGTALDVGKRNEANKVWDPANLPACYFALGSLLVLGDTLERVNKEGCLSLLCKLQRADGSFGEYLGHDNVSVMGGMDSRYGYCAMAVRWILRANSEQTKGKSLHGTPDVDVDLLVECIRKCETFDGGLSEDPSHEAHAGFTYCALGALSFLDRLPRDLAANGKSGLRNPAHVVDWLLGRHTTDILGDYDDEANSEEGDEGENKKQRGAQYSEYDAAPSKESEPEPSFQKFRSMPLAQAQTPSTPLPPPHSVRPSSTKLPSLPCTQLPSHYAAGFSGRANKTADTCYAFWAGASLKLLSSPQTGAFDEILDARAIKRYLLGHTQHSVAGGFGKFPGDPPDIYHSYMGLASLSILGHNEEELTESTSGSSIKNLDPALCMSVTARRWCESLHWRRELS